MKILHIYMNIMNDFEKFGKENNDVIYSRFK